MTRRTLLLAPLLAALALSASCEKEKTCSSDLSLCGDRCTSLATDAANCGACGHACGAGESCYGGACFCPFTTTCGGACVDLESDPAHCGACGVACEGALVCTAPSGGTAGCASSCAAGQTPCGRACVDLQAHRQNCGACGRTCGSNEQCRGGRCVADLYLACFNTDEVREASASLAAAGLPLHVAKGPMGLAWAGERLAVVSGATGGAETLTLVSFDLPGVRQSRAWQTSSAHPDLEYVAEHGGLLYVAHNSLGTLVILTPAGQVVDEVRLPAGDVAKPNPQGIAFDGAERAYVALQATGEVVVLDVSRVASCAAGTEQPPCTTELARIDLGPAASPGARPMPARIAVGGGRAFVALWNLDEFFSVTPGNTGRVGVIRTDTLQVDADFTGTTTGALDLGAGCLNASDVALRDGTLWVSCGYFDYSNYPSVSISGSALVPVDVSGTTPVVKAAIAPNADAGSPAWAPGKLAFCGATGYVGDRNTGRVVAFDPAAAGTALGAGVALCPEANGFAYVTDIACGR